MLRLKIYIRFPRMGRPCRANCRPWFGCGQPRGFLGWMGIGMPGTVRTWPPPRPTPCGMGALPGSLSRRPRGDRGGEEAGRSGAPWPRAAPGDGLYRQPQPAGLAPGALLVMGHPAEVAIRHGLDSGRQARNGRLAYGRSGPKRRRGSTASKSWSTLTMACKRWVCTTAAWMASLAQSRGKERRRSTATSISIRLMGMGDGNSCSKVQSISVPRRSSSRLRQRCKISRRTSASMVYPPGTARHRPINAAAGVLHRVVACRRIDEHAGVNQAQSRSPLGGGSPASRIPSPASQGRDRPRSDAPRPDGGRIPREQGTTAAWLPEPGHPRSGRFPGAPPQVLKVLRREQNLHPLVQHRSHLYRRMPPCPLARVKVRWREAAPLGRSDASASPPLRAAEQTVHRCKKLWTRWTTGDPRWAV